MRTLCSRAGVKQGERGKRMGNFGWVHAVGSVTPECHQCEWRGWGVPGNRRRLKKLEVIRKLIEVGLFRFEASETVIHEADINADAYSADCAHIPRTSRNAHMWHKQERSGTLFLVDIIQMQVLVKNIWHLTVVNIACCMWKQTISFMCSVLRITAVIERKGLPWTLEGRVTPVTHLHHYQAEMKQDWHSTINSLRTLVKMTIVFYYS